MRDQGIGMDISVSVIVPTRDSAAFIDACLRSIKDQTHAAAEVIVVDNYSSDETPAIARSLGVTVIQARPERSAQRNAGASIATGTHLLFVDSDMRLTRGVVEACVRAATEGYTAAVIPETVVGTSYWARCRELEKRLGDRVPGYEAARFVESGLFRAAGGFDESLVAGEDFDLHLSLQDAGANLAWIDARMGHLEPDTTMRDYVRKWRYYASTVAPFVRKRGRTRRQTPNLLRVMVLKRHLLATHPRQVPGLLLMKLIEFGVIGWQLRLRRIRE